MGNRYIFEGFLRLDSNGEEDDILFLGDSEDPFTEELHYKISNKFSTVRYFISNEKVSTNEAQESFIRSIYGEVDVRYDICYSEMTGYLWTTEELNVGGHDLLQELKSYIGKYLILIVDVDLEKEKEKELVRDWRSAKEYLNRLDSFAKKLNISRDDLINELDKSR